eukprot:1084607-Rhodomonas_salina.1
MSVPSGEIGAHTSQGVRRREEHLVAPYAISYRTSHSIRYLSTGHGTAYSISVLHIAVHVFGLSTAHQTAYAISVPHIACFHHTLCQYRTLRSARVGR